MKRRGGKLPRVEDTKSRMGKSAGIKKIPSAASLIKLIPCWGGGRMGEGRERRCKKATIIRSELATSSTNYVRCDDNFRCWKIPAIMQR